MTSYARPWQDRKPQTTNSTSPTIGVDEAAEILRCGVPSAQKLIETVELPALQLNQRHWVLLRDDVIEYVRVHARRQAQERKVEYARSKAKLQPVAPFERRGPRRRRRPLPDLDKFKTLLGISGQKT